MKKNRILKSALAMAALIGLASCASSSKPAADGPGTVFNQPLAKTQRAAVDALTVIGCDIKKQEPTYVEGHRPLKMGVIVGSGNETVKVSLTEMAPQKTSVHVMTDKSFVGGAGQKNWDQQVLAEMTKSLGQ
jgi:hypothetical protein